MFCCLSLSPTYIQAKIEWLKSKDDPVCKYLLENEDIDIKEIGNLEEGFKNDRTEKE